VTINGEIGDGFSARRPESEADFGRRLDRLETIAAALREADGQLAPGVHPVILHPRVVREFVLDTLLHNLDGATVDHSEGHFAREQFGNDRPVLREDVRLRLDPLQPFRSGSYRFTSEGLPATRCSFVERGRLVQPVLDLKYARRLDLPPTPQPYSSDVLDFSAGARVGLDGAMADADGGALVLSVLGVHTQDKASGDFSLAAPQALRLRRGRFAGRLRATISGNLFSVLRDPALQFVGFEGEHTPGLLFPCRLDPR
jgi:PmbA protein